MTCLPHYYAKLLGFEVDDLERADGHQASGTMPIWTLRDRRCDARVVGLAGVDFALTPLFVEGNVTPLWGRGDFFNAFLISFNEPALEFELAPL